MQAEEEDAAAIGAEVPAPGDGAAGECVGAFDEGAGGSFGEDDLAVIEYRGDAWEDYAGGGAEIGLGGGIAEEIGESTKLGAPERGTESIDPTFASVANAPTEATIIR